MDPPAVAASAEDAAGLGVQLAQDLYRLGSEYPNFERQIGSIAQAFADLNLALADLASVLPCADKVLCFSPPCLGYLTALVERIHGVQTTFRSSLNDDGVSAPAKGKAGNSKKQAKQAKQASLNKLGRLKTLFPGPGASDRFTEMEWLRNTIALLAAVTRLSITHAEIGPSNDIKQTGFRIVSETLTSAVLVYVRTINQKIADADDDSDDDEDPITGPGTLLFTVPASKSDESASAPAKVDAAVWIYEALRDRINNKEPVDRLPSVFVDWLLEETVAGIKPKPAPASDHEPNIVVNLDDVLTPTNNTFGTDTRSRHAASSDDDEEDEPETAVPALPAPDAAPNAALLARRAKKKGKRKAKANNVYKYLVESEPEPDVAATSATDDEQHGGKHNSSYATATEDVETDQDTNSAKLGQGAPLVHKDAAASAHSRPSTSAGSEKARESKFESQFGLRYENAPDQDDLPPPYPAGNQNQYMSPGPPGRGAPAPFGTPQFPYPQPSPMPYQNGAQAPANFDNGMPYMQGQPGMFPPVGFYPMGAPYGPQPFFAGGRPGAPGVPGAPGMTGAPTAPQGTADQYGYSDHFEKPFTGRPLPGMRKGAHETSHRDGPRGAGMAPKRRPAGTVLNASMFEEEDDDDDDDDEEDDDDNQPDEGYVRNHRGNARTRGRRDSYDSRSEDDFESSESPEPPQQPTRKERDKGKKAVNKGMRRQAETFPSDESDSEVYSTERDESNSLVRVTQRGKKHEHAAPPRTAKKKGSSSKQPEVEEPSDSDAHYRRRHASETEEETYYVHQQQPVAPSANVSSNSGKKRSAKGGAAVNGGAKRNGRAGKSAPQASKQAPSPRSQLSDVDETEDNEGVKIMSDSEEAEVRERETARKSGKSRKDQAGREKADRVDRNEKNEKHEKNEKMSSKKKKAAPKPAAPRRRPAHEASSSDASSSDDDDGQYDDAADTNPSPASDAKVFTPPPTPPDQPDERQHGRDAPVAHHPPPAPTPGVHNASKADTGAPIRNSGGLGGPKARQPIAHAIFPPAQMSAQQPHHHRSMSANPFRPKQHGNGGREAATGFGMPPPMDGAVKAALPGGLGPIGMRMGMSFWNGAPQGPGQGQVQGSGSDGAMTPRGPAPGVSPWAAGIGAPPGQGPVPRTAGITSPTSWVRGGENPTRSGPPPAGASGPQPAPAAGPNPMKPIPWHGPENGRGYEDDYDEQSVQQSEYDDDYDHHESEDDYINDNDEGYEYRDQRRPASPQYGPGYRHRSLSPPNNAHGHAAGPGPYGAYPPPPNARRPASDFRGPPPPQQPGAYQQFPPQQHPWQQPGPPPPLGQFPGGAVPQVPPSAADWGWPGDAKHPGGPGAQHPPHPPHPQYPQHPQHQQHPGGMPMMPHMAYGQIPPPQQIGAPPLRHGGWDDPAAPPPGVGYPGGFNDGYR